MTLMQGIITGIIVGLVVMAVEHKVYDRGWTTRSLPGISISMPGRDSAAPTTSDDLADMDINTDDPLSDKFIFDARQR